MKFFGCLFGSLFIGIILGFAVGGIGIAVSSKSVFVTRPLVCEDNETMAIEELSGTFIDEQGDAVNGTSFSYFCVRDGRARDVTNQAFLFYFSIMGIGTGLVIWVLWQFFGVFLSDRNASPSFPPTIHMPTSNSPSSPVIIQSETGQITLLPQQWSKIQYHIGRRNKIGAIKAMREATGLGLKDAKDLVEAIQRSSQGGSPTASGQPIPTSPSQSGLSREQIIEIQRYVSNGNKIQAIKLLREATGMGLKEAKEMVEAMQRGMHDFGNISE